MKYKILSLCIFIILLTTYVSAFGVTAFYYKGSPLILDPGKTGHVQYILQNEKTSSPVYIQAELSSSDIAQITGKTIFYLGTGETDVPVKIKVSIPETAEIGDEYSVTVKFTTTGKDQESKTVQLGTQIVKSIPIVVGKVIPKEEPEKVLKEAVSYRSLMGILVVLALVILALFLIRKKKKK